VTTRPVFDEHDNAAENALSDAMHASTLDEQRKFLLIAQVEATRSQTAAIDRLVEEQRTANLIALFREDGPEVFRADITPGMSLDETRCLDGQVRAQYLAVADDVARRVGLA
jgi:hypothetical protein